MYNDVGHSDIITIGKFDWKYTNFELYTMNILIILEDIDALRNQLPLPRYNAYILYDGADIKHVISMVEKLENEYQIKVDL